jgi:hypothetical protein
MREASARIAGWTWPGVGLSEFGAGQRDSDPPNKRPWGGIPAPLRCISRAITGKSVVSRECRSTAGTMTTPIYLGHGFRDRLPAAQGAKAV